MSAANNIQPSSPPKNTSALKTFGHDVGHDFLDLFSSRNMKPLIFASAATAASFELDHETREAFENGNRQDTFSNLGNRLGDSYALAGGLAAVSLIGLSTGNHKLKSVSYDLVRGYVLEAAVVLPLKHAVGRERPDDSDNLSFPSGHTTTGFLWATVLNHHYGPRIGVPAYAIATYIAASRLKRDVHYLSDVAAGAGIGYLIGRTVTNDEPSEKKLLWIPSVSSLPRGGLNLEVTLLF
ncbi:MAG TPA: phosphatase PAP2 family protein [Acidobacteriota bacterium]|nr:phosphatase PAP2 family protein [Acidobacteriota bacterium]